LIFEEYREKHFLSNFLKTGIMHHIWKDNRKITIVIERIESLEDYKIKKHLVELTSYKLSNEQEI